MTEKLEMIKVLFYTPKKLIKKLDKIAIEINKKGTREGKYKISRNKLLFIAAMQLCAKYETTGQIE